MTCDVLSDSRTRHTFCQLVKLSDLAAILACVFCSCMQKLQHLVSFALLTLVCEPADGMYAEIDGEHLDHLLRPLVQNHRAFASGRAQTHLEKYCVESKRMQHYVQEIGASHSMAPRIDVR